MDTQTIIIPPETLFETLVRYGLYLGAGFQLMCLAACVLLPGKSENSHNKVDDNEDSESEMHTPKKPATATTHHRRKVDKKKRR